MADSARQALGMLGSQVACLALSTIMSAVIARSLQPEGRGVYYLAITVATTATMLGHLSIEKAQSALWTDPSRREALAGNSMPLALVLGTLAALVGAACVAVVGTDTLNLPGMLIVAVACVRVPLGVAANYASNIALLRGRSHVAARSALAGGLVQCGVLYALTTVGGLTTLSVVIVWVIAGAVPLVVFAVAGGAVGRHPDIRLAQTTVVTGARYHLGPAAVFLLLQADVFLLGAFAGPREVGIYTLAVTFAGYSRMLADVLSQVMLTRQFSPSDTESAEFTARVTRFAVMLAAGSALVLTLGAPVLITAVYSDAYAGAVPLAALLAPGVMALGASRLPSAYLVRLRRAKLVVGPSVIALSLNIALNLLLIPVWGAVGSAVASTVAYTLLSALQVRLFVRATGIPARDLLPTRTDILVLLATVRRCLPSKHVMVSTPRR